MYYALKMTKVNVKNNSSKNTSSNEIKDIRTQFCKNTIKDILLNKNNSNHSKTILRGLTKSICKGLSELSSNKEIFQKATPIYFEAIKKSEFNEPLVFIPKAYTSDNTSKKTETQNNLV